MELISREDAIKCFDTVIKVRSLESAEIFGGYVKTTISRIKALPTIEERKEGMWIDKGRDDDVYDIKGVKTWATKGMCSECGFTTWFIESHMCYAYCPQCGSYNSTKMKGE